MPFKTLGIDGIPACNITFCLDILIPFFNLYSMLLYNSDFPYRLEANCCGPHFQKKKRKDYFDEQLQAYLYSHNFFQNIPNYPR